MKAALKVLGIGAFFALLAGQFAQDGGGNAAAWAWGTLWIWTMCAYLWSLDDMRYSLTSKTRRELIDRVKEAEAKARRFDLANSQLLDDLQELTEEFEAWKEDEGHAMAVLRRIGKEIAVGQSESRSD